MHTPRSDAISSRRSQAPGRGGAHRATVLRSRGFVAAIAAIGVAASTAVGLALAEIPGVSADPTHNDAPAQLSASDTPLTTPESTDADDPDDAEDADDSAPESEEPEESDGDDPDPLIQLAAETVRLTNEARQDNGCQPVEENGQLAAAAQGHSQDMADNGFFDHLSPDGSNFVDRAAQAGYDAAMSENIAAGQDSAEATFEDWMDSEGHRENILNCEAKAVGVGVGEASDGTLYWTQKFGHA